MSVLEIVIFNIGLLFSVLAHCFAWAILMKVIKVLERLKNCEDNIKSATKLVDNSSITSSVMQLSAEQLRFDPDVNEFERDVAVLMLRDPQSTYTAETMNRPSKQQKLSGLESKSGPQLGKKKTQRSKGDETEDPDKAGTKQSKEKSPVKVTLRGIGNELFAVDKSKVEPLEDKANNKVKKFKEPQKIQKADAKDPQYETLADVKDDIFKG
ncbi:hypothetical protein DICVIV_11278 [Dictyocaulus viviparus]|uniref:Uncharacterized protein n=1 Tax=Dictyocaulus viviparus TaxID=29172 RepID=A0A0D8XDQ3_DICVI|nr:hypothetical protein DICVIV_11278 [Dictyocaulus viviparus]